MKKLLILAILLLTEVTASTASLREPPNWLWKGLIAEAVDDGFQGMWAVACVVRNRQQKGMWHGLVALRRNDLQEFVDRQPREIRKQAQVIIRKVFLDDGEDTTGGAIYFENVERYGRPYFCKRRTVKIGRHTFYKGEVRG
jgi:spore germination cell wall hydrolase CwlJ-like protein